MRFLRDYSLLCLFLIPSGCQTQPGEPRSHFEDKQAVMIQSGAGPHVFEIRPPYNQKYLSQVDSPETTDNLINPSDISRPMVQKWIRYFTGNNRSRFARFLSNGAPYRQMIENTLEEKGLPRELYFLPLIESGYRIRAKSRASAVGPWQFMRPTGKRFGLLVNAYVDERRDPVRATAAAATYLKRLYKVFGSWELALSAYNSGESRVMNAILNHGTRDFWQLCAKKGLPHETRNYVPKLIAAITIGNNYRQYQIPYDHTNSEPYNFYKVSVPSPIQLRKVAKTIGVSYAKIRKWNPHILRGITPPQRKSYSIWVPNSEAMKEQHQLASLKRISLQKLRPAGTDNYTVRRGDSLSYIARKFSTNVRTLKSLNGMRGSRIRIGQGLKVPTYGTRITKNEKRAGYKVRPGDNLYEIARKFRTSINKIKRKNNMASNRIYAGQILKI